MTDKTDLQCWDDEGKSIDRYTVVWPDGDYVGMNAAPYHPQGFCQHGDGCKVDPEYEERDGELYSYLGKLIDFDTLPRDCQTVIERDLEQEVIE